LPRSVVVGEEGFNTCRRGQVQDAPALLLLHDAGGAT